MYVSIIMSMLLYTVNCNLLKVCDVYSVNRKNNNVKYY